MDHPIAPFAHAAFCTGFASTGATVTDHVRAGHDAAILMAIENWEDPNIIEATLNLGKLEGVWANIFARRKELYDSCLADFSDAWQKIWQSDIVPFLVKTIRQQAGIFERDTTPSVEYAAAIVLSQLQRIIPLPMWQELRLAVGDSITSGQATGVADAMELLADRIDVLGFDFNKAFTDAKRRFDGDPTMLAQVDQWLDKMLQVVVNDTAKKLIKLIKDDATKEEMELFLTEQLSKGNSRVFIVMLDMIIHTAITAGILWFFRSSGVAQVYFITAGDDSVCPECDAIEGQNPYPISDAPFPPIHPNCLIGSTRIVVPADVNAELALGPQSVSSVSNSGDSTAAAFAESGFDFGKRFIRAATVRDYIGDVVIIKTSSGKELTATPNHPIATGNGWIAISELSVGDYVISSTGAEWEMNSVNPDEDNVPPRIEEIAQSLTVSLGAMPTSSEDFHGDGSGSDVHVVLTNSFLLSDGESAINKITGKHPLNGRNVRSNEFVGQSTLDEFVDSALLAPDGLMSGSAKPLPFLRASVFHSHIHGVTSVSDRNVTFEQVSSNDTPADSEGFCKSLLAFSGQVALDKVVEVKRDIVSTQVYNLETEDGWYIGNGIVTHNCRCSIMTYDSISGSFLNGFLT